ncbi:MAG TPA: hypothetical protein VMR81_06050 [Patescibacteria group bacterium]|nr:hypothetical protein [Patescibacteria group bacterium]
MANTDLPLSYYKTLVEYSVDVMQMVGGMASDITERRKAEDALHTKTDEAVKLNNLTVGRELKMVELKKQIEI